MMDLPQFISKINAAKEVKPFQGRLFALDPGETTGWAYIGVSGNTLAWQCGQRKTWPEATAVNAFNHLFNTYLPTFLVFESYHIYDWKSDEHKWSAVHTVQVIGSIWTYCRQMNIPYHQQSAQNAKGFWTDDKLKQFGVYDKGLRHGRDAMRHALHYLCFGNKEQGATTATTQNIK
jgi:hypothetical protein